MNTQKKVDVFSKVLDAQLKTPQQTSPEEFQQYELLGLGSGIYGGKHHKDILDFADKLPQVANKRAFIFSTSFDSRKAKTHSLLREKLQSKGYIIFDEFNCKGFDTNSFLKLFGGIAKGTPNAKDLKHAEEFAMKLKQ